MIDPANLRASFAYGSGSDGDADDDKVKEFQTLQGPDAVGPTARIVHYTQIYERTVRTKSQEQVLVPNKEQQVLPIQPITTLAWT